jgi:hypothetical protein
MTRKVRSGSRRRGGASERAAAVRLFLPLALAALSLPLSAADYYVACGHGSDGASGASPAEAWDTLEPLGRVELGPGDRILLRRGTVCRGRLAPRGGGEAGRPAVIEPWGEGEPPGIDAAGAPCALCLWNQSHWRVRGVAVRGGTEFGIHVSGDRGLLRGIELIDVIAEDVHGPLKTKASGLIVVEARGEALFEDVLIDGARAARTTQWAGILVLGAPFSNRWDRPRSRRVTIRNSIARDVWGDGIVLFEVEDGLIERSAAWHTGMQPRQTIGTPNGIWTWRCLRCAVRACEAFWTDSPGVDGGAFDIDWGNEENVVEDSYGHDTLSYCAAVFGAEGLVTRSSVLRRNVCAGLGRSPRLARHHGAIHLLTWTGGRLDGVRIEDNRIEWAPPVAADPFRDEAEYAGGGRAVMRANDVREPDPEPPLWRGRRAKLEFVLDQSPDARGLRVVAESARAQYESLGLEVVEREGRPAVHLYSPAGDRVQSWTGYAGAAQVLYTLRRHYGEPRPQD